MEFVPGSANIDKDFIQKDASTRAVQIHCWFSLGILSMYATATGLYSEPGMLKQTHSK
jgi:hypothetical protein